jgi:hypothetical protein
MSSKTPENTRTTRRSNSAADSSKRKGTAGSSSSAKSPVRPKASDPFDFISKASIHPEPLKDISVNKYNYSLKNSLELFDNLRSKRLHLVE